MAEKGVAKLAINKHGNALIVDGKTELRCAKNWELAKEEEEVQLKEVKEEGGLGTNVIIIIIVVVVVVVIIVGCIIYWVKKKN